MCRTLFTATHSQASSRINDDYYSEKPAMMMTTVRHKLVEDGNTFFYMPVKFKGGLMTCGCIPMMCVTLMFVSANLMCCLSLSELSSSDSFALQEIIVKNISTTQRLMCFPL